VPDSAGIILSGWVNHPCYRYDGRVYVIMVVIQCVPYSLHSNFKEIHQFVDSIRPSFIVPIVKEYPD
jgi:mRNA degradation ribonuclease J1/J2